MSSIFTVFLTILQHLLGQNRTKHALTVFLKINSKRSYNFYNETFHTQDTSADSVIKCFFIEGYIKSIRLHRKLKVAQLNTRKVFELISSSTIWTAHYRKYS